MGHAPRLRLSRAALAALLLSGCTADDPALPPAAPTVPPAVSRTAEGTTGPAVVLCRLSDPDLVESSGLAAHGELLWTHADSGGGPRLYGLDRQCRTRTVLTLAGTDARDWEDVAATSGALWVADTGDNRGARTNGVLVHRVPVPDRPAAVLRVQPTSFRLRYEDGPRDAEALLVHPTSGAVVVVEKVLLGAAGVYAAPQPMAAGTLRRAGEVRVGAVTGGAVSPRGDRVVLRTYTSAYEWEVTDGDLLAALEGEPTRTGLPASEQGEGISYDSDGRSWLLSSEGQRAPVHRVAR